METIEINYCGVELLIEYEVYESDYGVDRSPVWDQVDINSVTVGNKDFRTELIEMLEQKQIEEIQEIVLEKLND